MNGGNKTIDGNKRNGGNKNIDGNKSNDGNKRNGVNVHKSRDWEKKNTRAVNPELIFKFETFSPKLRISKSERNLQNNHAVEKSINLFSKLHKKTVKRKATKQFTTERKISFNALTCYNRFSVLKMVGDAEEQDIFIETFIKSKKTNPASKFTKKIVKKKQKIVKKKQKIVKKTTKIGSSGGKFPQILRCAKCFVNHFPVSKFCKWELRREQSRRQERTFSNVALNENEVKIILKHIDILEMHIAFLEIILDADVLNKPDEITRLTGGAGSKPSLMINQAIESAKKHGINLSQGTLNNADGNCAFESVIHNINHRDCFLEKLPLATQSYRWQWVTELEHDAENYPTIGAGFSPEEKKENWDRLKESGVYEIPFFGDLIMNGIAKGCHKNILIFNTSIQAQDPIYVIEAKEFGGFVDSEIPVVLAYNQVHYESLHPLTPEDIEKTKALVISYNNGGYGYQKKDIEYLISETNDFETNIPPHPDVANKQVKLKTTVVTHSEIIRDEIIAGKKKIRIKKNKLRENLKNYECGSPKRRKILKVREMSEEDRRNYRKEQYRKTSWD